jgi:hypothetical protein
MESRAIGGVRESSRAEQDCRRPRVRSMESDRIEAVGLNK